MTMSIPKIVILGAGYGSLMAVKHLQKELHYNEAEVTLVNPNSYHYVTTKLHEPAAGTTSHESARIELSSIVDFQKIMFVKDLVTKIDLDQ
jgi:NADH dehydrogenase